MRDHFANQFMSPVLSFYHGLISLSMIGKNIDEPKWMEIANESICSFKNWSKNSPNYSNKLSLLEAEMAVVNGNSDLALNHYNKAIYLAKTNNFVHELALAYERKAQFFIKTKGVESASHDLMNCYQAYLDWGANNKANELQSLYPAFVKANKPLIPSSTASIPSHVSMNIHSSASASDITDNFVSRCPPWKKVCFSEKSNE